MGEAALKILWVKPGKLLPVDTGGKIRTYSILRHLAQSHELTFLSYYGGTPDPDYEQEIVRQLPGASPMHTSALEGTPLQRGLHYLRRLPSRAPFAVTKFIAPEVRRILAAWIAERRFDVAVCDFLSTTLNFPFHLATPTVLFQHNVETVLWRRKADYESNPIKRLAWEWEAFKMARYERAALNRFHRIIAVSEQDRRYMGAMTDISRIDVVSTGVDLRQYRSAPTNGVKQPLVVFIGSMDWDPNIDAVQYFCRDIWPRITAALPGARFRIVGRKPHPLVLKLASPTVEVTGTVPSVIEHLGQAAVVVVPMRIGGGTRLKIYEAMAMGKAVVSTSVGAEGLEVENNRDILLADDAAVFGDSVIAFLRDPDLRRRYETAAAAHAIQYDWSVIAQRFVEVLRKALTLVAPAADGAPVLATANE